MQQGNGTFNIEAGGVGASVIHNDTASIVLSGDGLPLSPLEADLAPGAITSTGGTLSVVQQGDGTYNIESTALQAVTTTSTTTIDLSGDGSAGNALEANLAAGAITSTDGSVTVTQQPDDSFDLSVTPVAAPISITSPDNSIAITPPVVVGNPYNVGVATTFTGSASVAVTPTPGNPPDYSFALTPTALIPSPNPLLTPVDVLFSAGQFQLGVSSTSVGGVIPNTVVVGGTIGATPNALTLSAALALLPPAIPVDSPWTLLICPGTYTEVGPIVIPVNVNLVALERGSVIIDADLDFEYTSADDERLVLLGLRLLGQVRIITSLKVGGTLNALLTGCTFVAASSLLFVARTIIATRLTDNIVLENCYFLNSGLIDTTGAIIAKGCRILCNVVVALSGLLQAISCVLAPLACTINGALTATSCVLGGAWVCAGVAVCTISSCLVNKATNVAGVVAWTLRNTSVSAFVSIRLTPLVHLVTRTGAGLLSAWSVDCPNLIPDAGGVDREIDITLLDIPLLLATITTTLSVPLITPLSLPIGVPPVVQPDVSTMVVTGLAAGLLASITSTVSSLIIVNTLIVALGSTNVNIKLTPPVRDVVDWYV